MLTEGVDALVLRSGAGCDSGAGRNANLAHLGRLNIPLLGNRPHGFTVLAFCLAAAG